MNQLDAHCARRARRSSTSAWIAVALASIDFVRRRDPRFPRWLAVVGALTVRRRSSAFLVIAATGDAGDGLAPPDEPRSTSGSLRSLEWLLIVGILVWTFLDRASTWRRATRMKAKRRVVTSASGASASSAGRDADAGARSRPCRSSARSSRRRRRSRPARPSAIARRPQRARRDRAAGRDRRARRPRSTCPSTSGAASSCANPILVASGTFGYGIEYGDVVDVERLGAICCKGTTLKPRIGNPTPRVTETPGGMLNSIGLQNPGVDAVIEKYAATWAAWQVPVIVNVAGESVEDYVEVARRLDGVPGVAGIELNISCPNVGKGGLQFAIDAGAAGEVTAAVRRATDLPLLVKLSPNVADVRPIARAIADAGADALTRDQHAVGDRGRARPRRGRCSATSTAGCPGPAIKPVALRIVYEVAQVGEDPGRRDRRRRPSSPTCSTSSPSARSRSRSARRSSPTRRCRSASSTSSPTSAAARGLDVVPRR